MAVAWLHVSDFHFKAGDSYDRDVVLSALIESVRRYREQEGRRPDLIFATGDIAHGGKPKEYESATVFFDALCKAAGVEKKYLFVVPGNHDVDRDAGFDLVRTLNSEDESVRYFAPGREKHHIVSKQRAFLDWHDGYFAGVRKFPRDSTCGDFEIVDVGGREVHVLLLNSALFCQDDDDQRKLWIGRHSPDEAVKKRKAGGTDLDIALLHHPLDWLHDVERTPIKALLRDNFDLVLNGHMHELDAEYATGVTGKALHIAAGACYQTRNWPNRAFYCSWDGSEVEVFPIRYEDSPRPVWTTDPSLFPATPGHIGRFQLARANGAAPAAAPGAPNVAGRAANESVASTAQKFLSNIPVLRIPFTGRTGQLEKIEEILSASMRKDAVIVLHGEPGAGKSELAKEYARRHRDDYPGGTFIVDGTKSIFVAELARLGETLLGLDLPTDMAREDRALRSFMALAKERSLMIVDNLVSLEAVSDWLPRAGMPMHVLITTNIDRWDEEWTVIEVPRLDEDASLELISAVAGTSVAERFGVKLASQADGLPVQIVPAAKMLAYEARRGRLDKASLTLTEEAKKSFGGVYGQLEPQAQLLLHAAVRFDPQRVPREELKICLARGLGWDDAAFDHCLDACLDFHLVQDGAELRLHQLFATFLKRVPLAGASADQLEAFGAAQAVLMVRRARALAARPNDAPGSLTLMAYRPEWSFWKERGVAISVADGSVIGRALYETGFFDEALPWLERAVEAKEKGDVHGRVDHASLGASLHEVGDCHASRGRFDEALPWCERAVAEAEKGDVHGRVDHESLGSSLHLVGYCHSNQGRFDEALPWFERAVAEAEKGDVHGRVDHASLGASLHQVGYCHSNQGRFDEALPRFERAVAEKEKGDVHGRVGHASLGKSLHLVGYCHSSQGRFDEALPRFERAVAEKEKGDVHGRVDHASLGASLHQVGYCHSNQGRFDEALPRFERAVAEAEKGDVHGRVNHESLGKSLRQLGDCHSSRGRFDEALPWFERAVAETLKGDVHGRVDHASLGSSLRQLGDCHSSRGRFDEVLPWFERAVAEAEKGDVHGRVDHASLGATLHQVGYCHSSRGRFDEALPRFERAVAEKEKGDVHGRVDQPSINESIDALVYCLEKVGRGVDAEEWRTRRRTK
jgi:tetratricopeptide (TPR) repeat protein/predicted phosphodiesterase